MVICFKLNVGYFFAQTSHRICLKGLIYFTLTWVNNTVVVGGGDVSKSEFYQRNLNKTRTLLIDFWRRYILTVLIAKRDLERSINKTLFPSERWHCNEVESIQRRFWSYIYQQNNTIFTDQLKSYLSESSNSDNEIRRPHFLLVFWLAGLTSEVDTI